MKRKTLIINDTLELRLPEKEFGTDIYKIVDSQRKYLEKWLPWVEHTNRIEDTLHFIESARRFNKGGQQLISFIFYKKKLVGSVSFVKISKENQSAEIGYWLSEKMQGKGIMTQSVKRLVKYGFEKMNLNRIEINVASANSKSCNIPKKLAFIHEGTLREYMLLKGKFHDIEKFSMLRKEWIR